jgi:hypothetical protein
VVRWFWTVISHWTWKLLNMAFEILVACQDILGIYYKCNLLHSETVVSQNMILRYVDKKSVSAETPRVNWNACLSLTNTCICMYVYYLSVYLNGETSIAVKTTWGCNAIALVSPWTPRKRCVIAVQSSCNCNERRVNAVQSPCNCCRPPLRSHSDLTTDSLHCHDVLGDCTALS